MKKLHLITAAAITLAVAATTIGVTYAATNVTGEDANPMHTLVTAIATKFNLSETDVQQVFDEQHEQIMAQHEQAQADRLAQAVTDGELTQAQADLIIAKLAELKTNRPDLKQWASDNDIPLEYLPQGGPGMHRPGMEHKPFGERAVNN